jgi:hypothetical protein
MTTAMTDEQRNRMRAFLGDLEQQLAHAVSVAADVRDDGEDASAFDARVARFERAIDALERLVADGSSRTRHDPGVLVMG